MRAAIGRALSCIVVSAVWGCGTKPSLLVREDRCGPPNPVMSPLPSLGADPHPFEIRHDPNARNGRALPSAQGYVYRFELERSGTQATLRAVVLATDRPALVVGDEGVALIRDPAVGWSAEVTGTTADLMALTLAPGPAKETSPTPIERNAPYVAVGAHGTAVIRNADGSWHGETTGTDAPLYALWHRGTTIAVGAGGAMLERSAQGVWRNIPTRTKADLFAVGPCGGKVCAAGAAGAVVECVTDSGELVCIPHEPATTSRLHVITNDMLLLGEGVWLAPAPSDRRLEPPPPLRWQSWPVAGASVAGSDARAAAESRWLGLDETVVVGRAGAIWLVDNWVIQNSPVHRLVTPYGVDFYGAAREGVNGFLVGAHGTIVKLGIHGYAPPKICLD